MFKVGDEVRYKITKHIVGKVTYTDGSIVQVMRADGREINVNADLIEASPVMLVQASPPDIGVSVGDGFSVGERLS